MFENGIAAIYNLFPTHFGKISEWTRYLPEIAKRGFNVVWVNPFQRSEDVALTKTDSTTGVRSNLSYSMYAMSDDTLFDPRVSLATFSPDGEIVLDISPETGDELSQLHAELKQLFIEYQQLLIKEDELMSDRREKEALLVELKEEQKRHEENPTSTREGPLKPRIKIIREQKTLLNSNIHSIKFQIHQIRSQLKHILVEISHNKLKQYQLAQLQDEAALREFTSTAISLNVVPVFDLVLNHVQLNSRIHKEHPEWFIDKDTTYHDVRAFIYSKLSPVHPWNVSAENREKILAITHEIIEKFWKPYIKKYIVDYGFRGVRVDFACNIPKEVKEPLYAYIKELCPDAILFEEVLFNNKSPSEIAKLVGRSGATHLTGSNYYRHRDWHGGLIHDPGDEEGHKRLMVEKGVVNFTGTHDDHSCATSVCFDIAREWLEKDAKMKRLCEKAMAASEGQSREYTESKFLYSYRQEIIEALNQPEKNPKLVAYFKNKLLDKLAINMFSGSAGYYALSGDECGSFLHASVFLRKSRTHVYPRSRLTTLDTLCERIEELPELITSDKQKIDQIIKKIKDVVESMAFDRLKKDTPIYKLFGEGALEEACRQRLLKPYIDQIITEIIAFSEHFMAYPDDASNFESLPDLLKEFIGKLPAAEIDETLILIQRVITESNNQNTPDNGWGAPQVLQNFLDPCYFQQMNTILKNLPAPAEGFWSELFKLDMDLFVAVRKNGHGYLSPTDIVVINLSPETNKTFDMPNLEKIANWMQQRGFPPEIGDAPYFENYQDKPDFHYAHCCITGEPVAAAHESPQTIPTPCLHFGTGIAIDPGLRTNKNIKIITESPIGGLSAAHTQRDMSLSSSRSHTPSTPIRSLLYGAFFRPVSPATPTLYREPPKSVTPPRT